MRPTALIATLLAMTGTSCVSVNIGSHSARRADGVRYTEPGKPFISEARKDVDAAWKNPQNGDLLSYLSDCQDDTDPSLDSIVQGAIGGLTDLKVQKQESPMVQGREARRVLASGRVDGVPSQIDILVFKRDNCLYILSYVGVQSSFADNHANFDHFVEGFHAP